MIGKSLQGFNLLLSVIVASGLSATTKAAFAQPHAPTATIIGVSPLLDRESSVAIAHRNHPITHADLDDSTSTSSEWETSELIQLESTLEQDVPLLDEIDRPATTIDAWMAQLSETRAEPVEIIDIQLNQTNAGVEIILITESGTPFLPQFETVGNALITEIPNVVLDLPENDEFQEFNPVEGIVLIEALTVNDQAVQLTITGTNAPPVVEIGAEAQHLVLNIAIGDPTPITTDDETLQVVVTGEQEGYLVPNATTATRTDTPLRDIPQSIQVIPQEVLEDQQVLRLNDAIRNVSGVVLTDNDPRFQAFAIRGFNAASVLRDGFRLSFGGTGNIGIPELANIQQIEVLKGPSAIIAGVTEPGGVVNLVSEQPSRESFYDVSVRLGNRELVEPSIDISGPLTNDGRVLYRLNALYRSEESFREFETDIERFFVSPVLSVQLGDRTDITFDFEYFEEDRPADFGLAAIGDEVADIPFDQILGEPGDINRTDFLRTGYQLEHRFSDRWTVRNAFHYTRLDTEFISASAFLDRIDESTGTLFRNFILFEQPSDMFELQTNVVGEFSTGPIDHTLLIGVDLFRREVGNLVLGDPTAFVPINIFEPVFGLFPQPNFDDEPTISDNDIQIDALGVYLQDQITLLDNLKLLVGFRYETFEQETVNAPSAFAPASETTLSEDAFTPRVGLVYQPIEPISLFASYSTSFSPNTATTVTGDILEPERGEQFEVGTKVDFLDGQFSMSLAYFNITLENVATPDPEASLFSVATGKQRSQGVELDFIGEITPGWNIVANYAFTDADVTEDNADIEGNRLFSIPRNNFNLWSTYEIQRGVLQGLGFGAGVNFVGERFGDLANSFTIDSYVLTNAAIFYRRNNWRAGLNIRNLFDIDYIESSNGSRVDDILPGEDFTIIGSISVEF